jgi:hypothetical protein
MGLRDLEQNTRGGVHIASLAGTRVALVGGSAGCATTRAASRLRHASLAGSTARNSRCCGEGVGCESRSASRKPVPLQNSLNGA